MEKSCAKIRENYATEGVARVPFSLVFSPLKRVIREILGRCRSPLLLFELNEAPPRDGDNRKGSSQRPR